MIEAPHVWLQYQLDHNRDDDLNRWRGDIDSGDFKRWKQALKSDDMSQIQSVLDQHATSPELSCTYMNPHNTTRWQQAVTLITQHTRPGDVVVDIGAGSHASVIMQLLTHAYNRHYVICDLTSPLLIAYYNLSREHRVKYVNLRDVMPGSGDLMRHVRTHDCVMVPHHLCDMLTELPRGTTFYNSYSFGEMSNHEVLNYMDIVASVRGRLISENYYTRDPRRIFTTCHLCDQPVSPIQDLIPDTFRQTGEQTPHVPTNTGAMITVHHS